MNTTPEQSALQSTETEPDAHPALDNGPEAVEVKLSLGTRLKHHFLVQNSDIANFTYNLGSKVKAGIPLGQALQRLQIHLRKPILRKAAKEMSLAIEAGQNLYEALCQHSDIFDAFYRQSIQMGEQSGQLDLVLEHLTELYRWKDTLQSRLLGLMIYPCFIIIVLLVVAAIFLGLVFPILLNAASDLHIPLSLDAQVFAFIRSYWFPIGFALVSMVASAVIFFGFTNRGQRVQQEFLLTIPYVSGLVQSIQASHFLSSLHLAYEAGLSMDRAFTLSSHILTNGYIREALEELAPRIANGESLAMTLSETDILPTMILENLAIGEESGQLGKVLEDAQALMTTEVNRRIDLLLRILQPATIVFLAIGMAAFLIIFYDSIFHIIGGALVQAGAGAQAP